MNFTILARNISQQVLHFILIIFLLINNNLILDSIPMIKYRILSRILETISETA